MPGGWPDGMYARPGSHSAAMTFLDPAHMLKMRREAMNVSRRAGGSSNKASMRPSSSLPQLAKASPNSPSWWADTNLGELVGKPALGSQQGLASTHEVSTVSQPGDDERLRRKPAGRIFGRRRYLCVGESMARPPTSRGATRPKPALRGLI